MKELLVGNAPCSWGTLEHQDQSQAIPSTQMLDELVETGYTGTELGDWGYMPTDPVRLSEELAKRNQRGDAGRVCAGGAEESAGARRGHGKGGEDGAADCGGGYHASAVPGAGRRQRDRSAAHQAGRARAGERGTEQGRVEDLCRRRRPDCARGVRRDGTAHRVSSSLRGLRGDAGRN